MSTIGRVATNGEMLVTARVISDCSRNIAMDRAKEYFEDGGSPESLAQYVIDLLLLELKEPHGFSQGSCLHVCVRDSRNDKTSSNKPDICKNATAAVKILRSLDFRASIVHGHHSKCSCYSSLSTESGDMRPCVTWIKVERAWSHPSDHSLDTLATMRINK